MKNKLMLIAIGGSLLLASPALRAEDAANKPAHPPRHDGAGKGGPPEHLLPSNLMEKLNLTEDQKTKIKAIEESFMKTRKEYMDAHKPELDAAKAAQEEAKKSEDPAKKKEAREKYMQAMAGLKPQRDAAIDQVKSLLSDEQKKILEEARQNMQERHGVGKAPGKDKAKDATPAAK